MNNSNRQNTWRNLKNQYDSILNDKTKLNEYKSISENILNTYNNLNTNKLPTLNSISLNNLFNAKTLIDIIFDTENIDKINYWFLYKILLKAFNNNELNLNSLININVDDLKEILKQLINEKNDVSNQLFEKYSNYNGRCFYPKNKNNLSCNYTEGTTKYEKCKRELVVFNNIICGAQNIIKTENYKSIVLKIIDDLYLFYDNILFNINGTSQIQKFFYIFYPQQMKQTQQQRATQQPTINSRYITQFGGYLSFVNSLDKKTLQTINKEELKKLIAKYSGTRTNNKKIMNMIEQVYPY